VGVGGDAAKKERLLIITCVSREKGSQSSLVHQQEGQGKKGSPSSLTCSAALELGIKLFQRQNHVPY
jgi:hypothetical protein